MVTDIFLKDNQVTFTCNDPNMLTKYVFTRSRKIPSEWKGKATELARLYVDKGWDLPEALRTIIVEDVIRVDALIAIFGPECLSRLYPHQREWLTMALSRLRPSRAILNCSEPGLGKTLMGIMACLAEDRQRPLLILAPKSAHGSFVGELRRLGYEGEIRKATPKTLKKDLLETLEGGAVICTYDALPPTAKEGKDKEPLEDLKTAIGARRALLADEFHLLKSTKALRTQRFRVLYRWFEGTEAPVVALTGTPILSKPSDLWCLLRNLNSTKFTFGDYQGFLKAFGGYMGRFGVEYNLARMNSAEITKALRLVVFRALKAEVHGMPEILETVVTADLTGKMKKALDEVPLNPNQLKQISLFSQKHMLAQEKLPTTLELIQTYEEAEEPILVVSDYREIVSQIGKRPGWAFIHGDISAEEREAHVKAFNSGHLKGLACTITCAQSFNLPGAKTMIFNDLNFTRGWMEQARKRIDRLDSGGAPLHYIYVQGDHPVETVILDSLRYKEILTQKSDL